jgi:hypothetical protein
MEDFSVKKLLVVVALMFVFSCTYSVQAAPCKDANSPKASCPKDKAKCDKAACPKDKAKCEKKNAKAAACGKDKKCCEKGKSCKKGDANSVSKK